MRTVLAHTVRWVHLVLLVFNITACLLPYRLAWLIHVWMIPLLILQWKLNKNTCVLTNLENILLGVPAYGEEGEGQFIRSVLAQFCDPLPSNQAIERFTI